MTEIISPDKNAKANDKRTKKKLMKNMKKDKEKGRAKKKLRNFSYENHQLLFGVHVFPLRIQQTKIMLSATVRYATRITTESSHLQHKVQGFHTQNNNSNKWMVLGKKKRKNGIFLWNLWKRQ